MMEKRLKLAKKLLNPSDSVLIVTIDEKECNNLGCLLSELFPEAVIQMITSVINPKGTPKKDYFARVEEYIYFVFIGSAKPCKTQINTIKELSAKGTEPVRWASLLRSGGQSLRKDTEVKFYPIFLNDKTGNILSVGNSVDQSFDISTLKARKGEIIQWPIKKDGTEGCWQVSDSTLRTYLQQGRVQIGTRNKKTGRWTINYLMSSDWERIKSGEINALGRDSHGALILSNGIKQKSAKTVWVLTSHSATDYGTSLLNKIIGPGRFTFPKSLYAVKDTIEFCVKNKPNALILDFFAGSGTTLQAINLINAEDGGKRRCILVTNNEVSAKESQDLQANGYQPGDIEWEKLGIARYVTWPRTVCSIKGVNVFNEPLGGKYLHSGQLMSDGLKANAAFFKLVFLDKTLVSLGRQFKELLPVLWMKAGAIGPCPIINGKRLPKFLVLPANKLAILIDEIFYSEFIQEVNQHPQIQTLFFVTDSESAYREMIRAYSDKDCFQLYRDYLDNFRINTGR